MNPKKRRLWILAAVAFLVLLIGGRAISGLYVQVLWFSHLGYGRFFWSLQGYKIGFGLLATLFVGGFLFANLYPLTRQYPRIQIRRRYGDIEIAELFPRSYLVIGALAVSLTLAGAVGLYVARYWTIPLLQLIHSPSWGQTDPVFGRDLSTYIFSLPVRSAVHGLFVIVLVATVATVSLAHMITGGLSYTEDRLKASSMATRHLGVLGGLILLLIAWGFWLGMQELLWAGNGVTGSLGYTDVNSRLPVRRILIVLSVVAAAATFYGAYRKTFRYAIISLAVVALAGLLVGRAYPAIVQKLRVEPNELDLERTFLEWNLMYTRQGYGLDLFQERDYPLDLQHIPDKNTMARVTSGLPLWDTRPLRATYNQFQGINPYYTFANVDYDRYGPKGRIQQVAVAVREIDISQLPLDARTWQNLHISETYKRGLGLVMTPAARTSRSGDPYYFVSGIPPSVSPDAPPGISLTWPSVYFGEKSIQYVLIQPGEVDEAGPQPRGVSLDSFWRKFSFAWTLGDRNLLLSREVRPGTSIVYERLVQQRVARLAPFLAFDADIYPVIHEDRIVWIQDAYTVTSYFPLSQRMATGRGPINYMRNSVKVTVDALTGETQFYVVDPNDPLIKSLQGAFPSLFHSLDEMPEGLRRHLRYARELLVVQSQILLAYHVRDARTLYHQLDLWDIPVERYREGEELVRPYYVAMPYPGGDERELEYLLMFPFTAHGRDNMRAFLIARSDLSEPQQVTLFRLPSEQVLGPRQVEVLIDQDPLISQQFTLWQQRGSRVIRGHLLVVPVEGTFVYVEPIFLEAESGGAAPSLSRVIAATPSGVAIGQTLEAALEALQSGDRASIERAAELTGPDPEQPEIAELRALVAQADSALRNGDIAEFGRIWARIRQLAAEDL